MLAEVGDLREVGELLLVARLRAAFARRGYRMRLSCETIASGRRRIRLRCCCCCAGEVALLSQAYEEMAVEQGDPLVGVHFTWPVVVRRAHTCTLSE